MVPKREAGGRVEGRVSRREDECGERCGRWFGRGRMCRERKMRKERGKRREERKKKRGEEKEERRGERREERGNEEVWRGNIYAQAELQIRKFFLRGRGSWERSARERAPQDRIGATIVDGSRP